MFIFDFNFISNMMKKNIWLFGTLGFVVLFILSAVVFRIAEVEILPSQFYGALIAVVITAIITLFLLKGQTANEEAREISVRVFDKKQEIYHSFIDELKRIIQEGEITIASKGSKEGIDKNVDELKNLIFQLAILQMHTSEENIKKILASLANIIQLMNDFSNNEENERQKELPEFYSSLSENLFAVVAVLKADLYQKESTPISKEHMNDILKECDLIIDNNDFDKYEIQKYFWDELQKQLITRGYSIEHKDFTTEIQKYYQSARNRYRNFGIEFIVNTQNNHNFDFKIDLENSFYYGFPKKNTTDKNELINKALPKLTQFQVAPWWFAWKYSDNFDLDFWRLNSHGFEELKNKRRREKFIIGLSEEIDRHIKEFCRAIEDN